MPDESLDILIRTKADLKGSTEAAGALNQVTDAVKKDGQAMEEAAKKTGFLSLKKTELKKLVRELGHEFPIAGMAARAMMNPIVASLTICIGLFVKAKEALNEWNKKLDEAAAAAASRDFLPGMDAKKEALHNAAIEAATLATNLKSIFQGKDPFLADLTAATAAIHAFSNAMAGINNAQKAKELAGIDLQLAQGKIKPDQAEILRGGIDKKYSDLENKLKTDTENADLKVKEAELQHRQESAAQLEKDAQDKAKAAADAKARVAEAEANLPGAKKILEEKTEAYRKALDEFKPANGSAVGFGAITAIPLGSAGSQAQVDAAKLEVDRQAALVSQYEKTKTEYPEKLLPGLNSAAKLAESRATGNASRIVSLEDEVGVTRRANTITQEGRGVVQGLQGETTNIQTQTRLQTMLKDNVKDQTELAQQIDGTIRSNKSVNQVMLKKLQDLQEDNDRIKAEIGNIKSRAKVGLIP